MSVAGLFLPVETRLPDPGAVMWSRFDLGNIGYRSEEFVVTGKARAFARVEGRTASGAAVQASGEADYSVRAVVFSPIDTARQSGTCVVEWLNCREIVDTAPQWIRMHREMARSGMTWVGVSAQSAGIEGASGDTRARHLKALDPGRYAALHHPGDAYSFDIFSQAMGLVREGRLSTGAPRCILATGSSQSARYLTTYANLIDPLAQVCDGFLLSGRHRSAATLEGASICGGRVPIRGDVRVPVFVLQPETDPFGRMMSHEVRQEDAPRFRLWEVAGAAHGDSYMAKAGNVDDGLDVERLAAAYRVPPGAWLPLRLPMNASPAFHYVHQAALRHLEAWALGGAPPPAGSWLSGDSGGGIARDEWSVATGGVRTPWVDCPALIYSGDNSETGEFEGLFGSTLPPPPNILAALYPGGEADYLRQFDTALQRTIAGGFMLEADAEESRQLARIFFRQAKADVGDRPDAAFA